jgi:hypothetical protein
VTRGFGGGLDARRLPLSTSTLDGIDLIIVEGDFWIASQRDEFNQWSYEPCFPVIRGNGGHFVRIHRTALERWLEQFALASNPRPLRRDDPPPRSRRVRPASDR